MKFCTSVSKKIAVKYHCDFCAKRLDSCCDNDGDQMVIACQQNNIDFVKKRLSCPRFKWFFHNRYSEFFVTACFSQSLDVAEMIYGYSNNGKLDQFDLEFALTNAKHQNHLQTLEWLDTLPELKYNLPCNNQSEQIALLSDYHYDFKKYLEMKETLTNY